MAKYSRAKEWAVRLGLMAFGVVVATGIITIIAPRVIPKGNERFANLDLGTVNFTSGMGDLFLAQPGSIRPPENPYEVLSSHRLGWDEEGFRIPRRISETYSIITLGDSYTEAANVAAPWPDILADELDEPVRNLGFRGYGPQEEAIVMREYGLKHNAQTIIVGFFGGNDISNAGSFDSRSDGFVLPELIELTVDSFDDKDRPWESDQETFRYPVTVEVGNETGELAFFNSYISWLNVTEEDLRNSRNLEEVIKTWAEIREMAGPEACIVIAFLPSKAQIYVPFIIPEHRASALDGLPRRGIEDADRSLRRIDDPNLTWEMLLGRITNTRDVLQEAATAEGFVFFDLSSAFEDAASSGEILYYTYDTHWNQNGHNLAGRELASFLKQGGCDQQ